MAFKCEFILSNWKNRICVCNKGAVSRVIKTIIIVKIEVIITAKDEQKIEPKTDN